MKHFKIFFLLILLVGFAIVSIIPSLLATSATTLSISPSHAPEGSTVGITLTLTGYTGNVGQKFNFTIRVTDPFPHIAVKWKLTPTIPASGGTTVSFNYSSEFSGSPTPTTNLNGTYIVQIVSSNATNYPVTPFSFTVGPADQITYQRTQTVSILANGYIANDFTMVNITLGAVSVPGFPRSVKISPAGVVSASWKIPVNQGLGNYVVEVSGNSTKPILDQQRITVKIASLSVSGFSGSTASGKPLLNFVRGDTGYAIFNLTYPDGTAVTTGADFVNLTNPNNTLFATLTATYNSTQKQFLTSSYFFAVNAPTGSWTLRIDANNATDAYGNAGPPRNNSTSITLQRAVLKTSISTPPPKTTYNRTTTFGVTATVSYPTTFTFGSSSGQVSANLTSGSSKIPQPLTFNAMSQKWQGNLTIPPNFPLGFATLQVSAHDSYGNAGSNSTVSIIVTVTTIIVHETPFSVNGTNFYPFQTLVFHINATYVNNQTLILRPGGFSNITFNLPGGRLITVALTLESNGNLTGQYTVRDTDPLGRWNLTIARWQFKDGNMNLNSKSVLGPIINILPIRLKFDSSYFKAPGNITITGDKVTLGIAFHYPNGTNVQTLIVNTTIFANGQYNNYTFTYDGGTSKYLTTIDTTGWAPGRYQVNITAYYLDYRGSQVLEITVQPTPFLLGPIVGVLLILVILGVGAFEYSRRGKPPVE